MNRGNAKGMGRLHGRALVLALCALPQVASATGFFLNQQSVQGLGRTDAGNAVAANDASTIYFNPAGMAWLWRDGAARETDTLFAFGTHLIVPRSDHLNTGSTANTFASGGLVGYAGLNGSNPTPATPVPNLFIARRLEGDKAFIGLGMTSPFGLSEKFGNEWFGRYDSIETSLRTINVSAVGAYQISPSFAIGGGLDVQYAKSKQVVALPNPLLAGGPTVASDAYSVSTASAVTPGFNIGFMWQADEATRLGLHYRSGMRHKMTGKVATGGLPAALAAGNGVLNASSVLKLPQVVTAGASRVINDKLTLFADIDWYGWGVLNELRVQFENGTADAVRAANYRNTFAYSIGGEYKQSETLTLRGGVQWDFTPTVDGFRDTTFADANRLVFAAGASVRYSKRVYFDFAANHVKFRTATVAVQRTFFPGTAVVSTVNVNDAVTGTINTLSAQIRYAF
jgi:long-chain fatty acid transport protein